MNEKLTHEWRLKEDDLRLMRVRANMAEQHPTWSVAYAEDIPKLLVEIARLKALIELTDEG